VLPPRPPTPNAKRGILKQKHSKQEIHLTPTEPDMELRHRPSQCVNCGYGTGSALTPSVSQDHAMSELLARLHAAEVAAEVEGLQPNRLLQTDSGSSSDKSATGVIGRQVVPPTEQSIASTDTASPAQQHPQVMYPQTQTDPTVAHKVRRPSNARDTKDAAKKSATTLPLGQFTPSSKSRFHEGVPNATRSTPTLTTPIATSPTPAEDRIHPKRKPRVRFRPMLRWAWTGLRKKPKATDPEQESDYVPVAKSRPVR
jgi:hypothetical protein